MLEKYFQSDIRIHRGKKKIFKKIIEVSNTKSKLVNWFSFQRQKRNQDPGTGLEKLNRPGLRPEPVILRLDKPIHQSLVQNFLNPALFFLLLMMRFETTMLCTLYKTWFYYYRYAHNDLIYELVDYRLIFVLQNVINYQGSTCHF